MKTKNLLMSLVLGLGSMVGLLWVLNGWPVFVAAAPAATITVTSTADSGPGTLRQALLDAVNGDVIGFDTAVFPPSNPQTITITSGELPAINQGNLTIDASDAGVILDGSGIGTTPETVLVDDVSLTLDGGPNQLANGDFGAGLGHWRPCDERSGATRSLNTSNYHSSPNSYEWSVVAHVGGSRTVYDIADTSDPIDDPFESSTAWITATGGSTVEVRFWYRYGGLGLHLEARLPNDTDGMGDWWFDSQTNWTEAVVSVTLPSDAAGVALELEHRHSQQWDDGLISGSNDNVIRGLQIVNFPHSGIVLDGAQDNVIGGNNTIGAAPLGQGNLISGNGGYGIEFEDNGTMSNTVSGNYIGTDVTGTVALGNGTGVSIIGDASYNLIGGTNGSPGGACTGECNLISGNRRDGVRIGGSDAMSNTVSGNYIGTDVSGTGDLGNDDGVQIQSGASGNVIGGDTPGERNVISGNDEDDIEIMDSGTMSNVVSGNYIGTDASGTAIIGGSGSKGIFIASGASYNLIGGNNGSPGGACTGECNLISGHSECGIGIHWGGTMSNTVSGNYIGTDVTGAVALGNGTGVIIGHGATYNLIGGDLPGERNILSGNEGLGVFLWDTDTSFNIITGNYVGTDPSGTTAVGNGNDGVHMNGASYNRVIDNLISGNTGNGVGLCCRSETSNNTVSGNIIGLDVSGTAVIPNGYHGVIIGGGPVNNLIGGDTPGERNVISGNDDSGVMIEGNGTMSNTVSGNYIGTDISGTTAISNTSDGVSIQSGASRNTVGISNTIAFNAGYGVQVQGSDTLSNTITRNSIHGNDGAGIALTDGGNAELAAPVIVSTSESAITGTACANCTVEVFSDDEDEGRVYEGTTTADAFGHWSLVIDPTGSRLTATATDADGNTSQFSSPLLIDLAVVKQASAQYVRVGETLTYTVVVTNGRLGNVTGVVLTDTLDVLQRATAVDAPGAGCTIVDAGWGGRVVCTPGTLASGSGVVVTLTVQISPTANIMGVQAVVNSVVVRSNEAEDSAQATIYIHDCHVRINAGATEYPAVQAAVDVAGPGDVVKVAGMCVGVNTRAGLRQQVYVDKSITIRGGYTATNWTTSDPEANPTTLDALGQGRVLYVTGDISPTIEGLRITGGDASGLDSELSGLGGGWYAGGGVCVVSATATISNNWIYGNRAGETMSMGGGVHLYSSSSTVAGNTISGNTACAGGGVLAYLTSNTLSGNTVMSNTAHWDAGGMCLLGGDDVIGNVVVGNTTPGSGGGIFLGSTGSNTLANNVVADNYAGTSGSGLYINGSSELWHTTVAHNTGGDGSGIYVTEGLSLTSVVFTNTIVSQQVVGIRVTGGNTVTVNGVLWHNTFNPVSQSPTATVSLQNQHWGNPAFVYPAGGDYHIDADSAAIDRGVDAVVGTDIDGQSRPIGAGYDLGADEYPCDGVSNVQLSRTPSGDLFTGNTVLFTAEAGGSTPFTYTWTLNGGTAGENRGTFEHIIGASGTYTVGVTVTNACGSDSTAMVVVVSDPAPQQPDLSQSNKTVNLASVEGGDILTYTLVVRNLNAVTATATLTDTVPNHTTYVPGSAQASSGSLPTVENGRVRWSGQVITGTPVVIQFAAEVTTTGLAVGDVITNVAYLDDGMGNVMTLDAQSTYNPGYGLSINDGALFTDIPTVTLGYSWNVADQIVYVKFSNDGGFGVGSSGWIPVNATDPTYDDWVLDTYGDLRVPRTVYAKFRSSGGAQYGPFQDDIVYDVGDPQVTEVEIITQTADQYVGSVAGQDVIVRVTSSDDNSGAGVVQISHGEDFAQYSEFAVTGATTDVPWVLQSSGEVYVRVVDRAGNVSQVESEQGPSKYEIYLPLVVRSY